MRAPALILGGALAGFGLAGCLDLALVAEVAFPPTMRGLAPDQPWVPLPVGSWVSDGPVVARAVVGCFAPSCAPRAAIGLFRASGAEAGRLAAVIEDPERLARFLRAGRPPRGGVAARPVSPVAVSAERLREDGAAGFLVSMSAADGSRPAYGAVLTSRSSGVLSVIMVVADSAEGARRIAREVGPNG